MNHLPFYNWFHERERNHLSHYRNVAVWSIIWADGDDPGYEDESNRLLGMFKEEFGYRVYSYNIPLRRPGPSLLKEIGVMRRMIDNDSGSLLIIHYGGHGVQWYTDEDDMMRRRAVWAADPDEGSPRVNWFQLQDELQREIKSDVLLLADHCYAGSTLRGGNNQWDALAACEMNLTTYGPGPSSFTRHFIRVTRDLFRQNGIVSVTEIASTLVDLKALSRQPVRRTIGGDGVVLKAMPFSYRWPTRQLQVDNHISIYIKIPEALTQAQVGRVCCALDRQLSDSQSGSLLICASRPSHGWRYSPRSMANAAWTSNIKVIPREVLDLMYQLKSDIGIDLHSFGCIVEQGFDEVRTVEVLQGVEGTQRGRQSAFQMNASGDLVLFTDKPSAEHLETSRPLTAPTFRYNAQASPFQRVTSRARTLPNQPSRNLSDFPDMPPPLDAEFLYLGTRNHTSMHIEPRAARETLSQYEPINRGRTYRSGHYHCPRNDNVACAPGCRACGEIIGMAFNAYETRERPISRTGRSSRDRSPSRSRLATNPRRRSYLSSVSRSRSGERSGSRSREPRRRPIHQYRSGM